MDDWDNLQHIYEGFRGQTIDFDINSKYAPNSAGAGHTYRKGDIPTTTPGGGSQYSYGSIPSHTIPVGDEETVKRMRIDNYAVLSKIDELIDEAKKDEMMYAIHQLSTLKKFVKGIAV